MDLSQQQTVASVQSVQSVPPNPTNPQVSKHIPTWVVIVLLIVFPPAALFIIFKEKQYHSWLPVLLWLFAIPYLFIFAIMRIFVTPQLETLYKNLNLPNSISTINVIIVLFMILLFTQTIYGFIISHKRKLLGYLSIKLLIIALLFFVIDFISPAFILVGIIKPIYTLTSSIGSSATPKTTQYSPSPTPDPTANWKTFTNTIYGFSFKYPDTATVQELPALNNSSIPNGKQTVIQIDDAKLSIIPNPLGDLKPPLKVTPITIDGIKTDKSYITNTHIGIYLTYRLPNNYKQVLYITFDLPSESSKREQIDNLLDQILSTFKFTK